MDMEVVSNEDLSASIVIHAERLKNLRLTFSLFEGISMKPLSQLVNLETLNVSYCDFIKNGFLMAIGQNCKSLKALDISGKYKHIINFRKMCLNLLGVKISVLGHVLYTVFGKN